MVADIDTGTVELDSAVVLATTAVAGGAVDADADADVVDSDLEGDYDVVADNDGFDRKDHSGRVAGVDRYNLSTCNLLVGRWALINYSPERHGGEAGASDAAAE